MDTYGNTPGRLAYPFAMACLPQASARFHLHDRAIVLHAICLCGNGAPEAGAMTHAPHRWLWQTFEFPDFSRVADPT